MYGRRQDGEDVSRLGPPAWRIGFRRMALVLGGLLAASGCSPRERGTGGAGDAPAYRMLDDTACRATILDDAAPESLQRAAERNLDFLSRQPRERTFPGPGRRVTVAELEAVSEAILEHRGEDWSDLCGRFRLYERLQPTGIVVTGYYQPELPASRRRTTRFRYPLYRTPDDLIDVDQREFCPECPPRLIAARRQEGRIVPYYTRAEIEAGVLAGREQEIAWLDDPVEAYFLHIQGSALLRLEDGVLLQVSHASANGHPYTSLGRALLDEGRIPPNRLSLRTLKDYLRAHPEEQEARMATNARYIFFRGVVAGPIGSNGVPLTAGRSVAADPEFHPHGAVALLRIGAPGEPPGGRRTYQRMVLFQDAGSVISGPQRLDVYWGSGPIAEEIAGGMNDPGQVFLLLPAPDASLSGTSP